MSQSTKKSRSQAFDKQSGRCYYCNCRMWRHNPRKFALAFGISVREANRFQCTAEHLVARQNGGSNAPSNIVAACKFCNQTRHRRPGEISVQKYRGLIARRLENSKWHPLRFHRILV